MDKLGQNSATRNEQKKLAAYLRNKERHGGLTDAESSVLSQVDRKRKDGGKSGGSSVNLPEYDGKTTYGVLVLDDGTQIPFSSGNANPNW